MREARNLILYDIMTIYRQIERKEHILVTHFSTKMLCSKKLSHRHFVISPLKVCMEAKSIDIQETNLIVQFSFKMVVAQHKKI